jgi:poly(A) polymerase
MKISPGTYPFSTVEMKILRAVTEVARDKRVETYAIGGYVRDKILDRPIKDIDIVCVGDGISFAKEVSIHLGVKPPTIFRNFGTAMIMCQGMEVEFVGARKESYNHSSRKPSVSEGTLQDDQNRRDFTVNALAISLNEHNQWELLDPFGGLEDMKMKLLRTPMDPDRTFSDDPLRMMRAVRFTSQLGFQIDEESFFLSRRTGIGSI